MKEYRSANGFDVHKLIAAEGKSVILGGYKIHCDKFLAGHSDADVALHAITDAILGLACAGDIGEIFPPSDPQWRNANSAIFIHDAVSRLTECQGSITFIDLTIICEQPKIGKHRQQIRESIAQIINTPLQRISVKATTTEQLGFLGRGEGIAALATVTASFS